WSVSRVKMCCCTVDLTPGARITDGPRKGEVTNNRAEIQAGRLAAAGRREGGGGGAAGSARAQASGAAARGRRAARRACRACAQAGRPEQELMLAARRESFRERRRRRRGGRRERRRAVYLLPNLITSTGLMLGFWSITLSIRGEFEKAALAIVLAMVCDMLDGR